MQPGQENEPPPEGMEYCQITGALTPTSDIVELHGYRVCAEGKMEILRRLRAGLTLPGELETSTIGARLVALIVDGFVLGLFSLIGGLIVGYNIFSQGLMADPKAFGENMGMGMFRMQGGLNLAFYVVSAAYYTIMHGMKGQTLGKMAARIKVVDLAGGPINYKKAFLRAVFYQGPHMLAAFSLLLAWTPQNAVMIFGGLSLLAGLWALADVLLALTDRAEQKSLHDRLAATRVVMKL